MQRPGFWDDQAKAAEISAKHARAQKRLKGFEGLQSDVGDLDELLEMASEDEEMASELSSQVESIERRLAELEEERLFSGEYDAGDAVVTVNAGAGGTDSQDWAEMLLRMYLRWAERRGFKVDLEEVSAGQEAGISSATFTVSGRHAFGLLQAERGVHRLVRISPFDAAARRHTAFASLSVVPALEEGDDEIVIDETEIRVDTYRSSGAGGQHVNVTDSAVRITHLPTGVVVSCQNERSQHQNKDRAMANLKAKLADLRRQEREEELAALSGDKKNVEWGSQIRSYVLHPYQQVKDLRTGHETGNVDAVLDGDLDAFMEAWLQWARARDEEDDSSS
jgi:peptide chain release factor 2